MSHVQISSIRGWMYAATVVAVVVTMACGDSNDGGGGGSPTTPSGSGPGPSGATITLGANGVSAASVSITVGQSVTIINNSGSSREIASDPHPQHTSCPSINALGIIGNGQTKLTNSFTGAGTCTFHDHGLPDNNSLKGTITIR